MNIGVYGKASSSTKMYGGVFKTTWSGPLHKIRMIKLNRIFKLTIPKEPKTIPTTYENI